MRNQLKSTAPLAEVTHELRAPLSSIRAALQMLQCDLGANADDKQSRLLAISLKNCDRLAGLIAGILDSAKLESGKIEIAAEFTDPFALAEEAVDALRPSARDKGLELTLTAPSDLPLVDADSVRSVQVLINLLSNAIKFTPAGGRVELRLSHRIEEARPVVEFAVSDTGPGIPRAEQGLIFEKFARISSRSTCAGGTGLGLSIAKELVRLQNGRMWVESDFGRGATFFFTLPALAKAVPARRAWWAVNAAGAELPAGTLPC